MPVVLIEKETPQIIVLTLNRPERRNALTIELLSELNAAIKIASDQPDERVIILRGAGAAFCTGLDLKEGQEYVLSYKAKGDPARTIQVNAMIDVDDWHPIGLSEDVDPCAGAVSGK